MFVAYGIWCLADVSSVSPSSEQSIPKATNIPYQPLLIKPILILCYLQMKQMWSFTPSEVGLQQTPLTALRDQRTLLDIHGESFEVHFALCLHSHPGTKINSAISKYNGKLCCLKNFEVFGVVEVSIWDPNLFDIISIQSESSVLLMSESRVGPLLAQVNEYLEFLQSTGNIKVVLALFLFLFLLLLLKFNSNYFLILMTYYISTLHLSR